MFKKFYLPITAGTFGGLCGKTLQDEKNEIIKPLLCDLDQNIFFAFNWPFMIKAVIDKYFFHQSTEITMTTKRGKKFRNRMIVHCGDVDINKKD